jgi:hypothetical protein
MRQAREILRVDLVKKLRRMAAPAPESLVDLLQQGICGRQICQMLNISREKLAEECNGLGLIIPSWDYKGVTTMRAPGEPGLLPEQEASLDAYTQGGKVSFKEVPERILEAVEEEPDDANLGGEPSVGNKATTVIEEVVDAAVGKMTVNERIRYLSQEGFNSRQIKDALGVSAAKVKSALKSA